MDEQGEDEMAHRRGKVVRKKRSSRTERPDLVSKVSQSQKDPGYDFEIFFPPFLLFSQQTQEALEVFMFLV